MRWAVICLKTDALDVDVAVPILRGDRADHVAQKAVRLAMIGCNKRGFPYRSARSFSLCDEGHRFTSEPPTHPVHIMPIE